MAERKRIRQNDGRGELWSFLNLGFAPLLFQGSNLLISFILQKLGFPSERISEKVRFVVGRRIKVVKATKNELEIELD